MTATIAILMATWNGAKFLRQQLDSFERQTYPHWVLHVSDDGSTDDTLAILEEYKRKWGEDKLIVHQGPKKGFALNFMSLVHNRAIDADYYAFSDQDDIFYDDKLARALQYLPPPEKCALYCSGSTLIDDNGKAFGALGQQGVVPGFANALCQNIAGGNTMVFSRKACELMRSLDPLAKFPYHDWWAYIIVTGAGGTVFFDRKPTIYYRQHGNNVIGSNNDWKARIHRIRNLFAGTLRTWSDQHIVALQGFRPLMTEKNRAIFDRFAQGRDKSLVPRLWELKKTGIYRQSFYGNAGLALAALLKKV